MIRLASSNASTARSLSEAGRKPSGSRIGEPQGNPQGNPDNWTEGSRPKKSFPPVTQEVEGASELDEDEEELKNEDIKDDDGLEDGFVARNEVENEDAGRPTDDVVAQTRAALALE